MDVDMVTVWLEEEYGYRYWRWDTGMTHEELVSWWSNLESVMPYFFDPSGLPGTLTQLDGDEWDEGTLDMPDEVPEDFCPEDYAPDDLEWARKHARMLCGTRKSGLYKAHIHMNDDSMLRLPDETLVTHAGFKADSE